MSDSEAANQAAVESLEEQKDVLISLKDVGLYFEKNMSLFNALFRRKHSAESRFWALKKLSLDVYAGDVLGIIGRNGSGKSTLSMVCSQVYRQYSGEVTINGKVQLLALGVGFQVRMTGRENIFISGNLLGMTQEEIKNNIDDIIEFADIGEFIDEPIRTYSSGMRSRLAFGIATAVKPDVLILDEVMAVGDRSFQQKASERLKNIQEIARCAIVISHSPGQLRKLCNKVIWLDQGWKIMEGDPVEVTTAYNEFCNNPQQWKEEHPDLFAAGE